MRVQAKVALDTLVPCAIVGGAPVNPLLIAHRGAPLQEGLGVRPDRVPQLPGTALDNVADLLPDQEWGCRVLQRRGEQASDTARVRVRRSVGYFPETSGHRCVNNARLDNGHPDVEHFRLLRQSLA